MAFFRIALFSMFGVVLVTHAQTTVPTVSRIIPTQTLAPGGAAVAIDLANYLSVAGVTGQIVQFDTVLGKFNVELRADAAPQNVANFLGYVQRGDYANSFFHRSTSFDGGGISIVQGGGYSATSAGIGAIATKPPVPLEYNLPNERGTLAAARTSDVNSATSQWYFNLRDNSTVLGPSNGGGYTVFGRVLGGGMTVVDAVAALPRVNASNGDPNSAFSELPVQNYTAGQPILASNLAIVNSITPVPLFSNGTGAGALSLSETDSASGVVGAALNGSVLTLTPVSAGSATITVHAADVNGGAVDYTFAVSVSSVAPTITSQPTSYTIATGNTAVFSATASAAMTYQWQHNSTDLPGATDATLVINNAGAGDAGAYALVARNSTGSATSNSANLTVSNVSPSSVGRLINLSIRSNAGTGVQTLTVGFAVGGDGTSGNKPLLLRAAGPSLVPYGVNNFLPDPVATLFSGSTAIAANDNWGGDPTLVATAKQVGAFDFISASSLDSAMVQAPGAGTYSMAITGNGGATGAALAEIYDATAASSFTSQTPRLINVSARSQVNTGADILTAGFAIGGSTAKTVLIRATGPALATYGVTGFLVDPKLQLYAIGNTTPLAVNDDWGGDPHVASVATSVGAFPLTNGASKDSAILITLPPGNYSAQVSGADGGTGVGLVEVYEVP